MATTIANLLARLLLPRLRSLDPKTLRKLKTELDGFNARTGRWKVAGAKPAPVERVAEPNPSTN